MCLCMTVNVALLCNTEKCMEKLYAVQEVGLKQKRVRAFADEVTLLYCQRTSSME